MPIKSKNGTVRGRASASRMNDEDLPWEGDEHEHVPAVRKANSAVMTDYGNPGELMPGFGNVGVDDLVVPRVKLLQGMSPECKPVSAGGLGMPQGMYFHTSEAGTIGEKVTVVPLGIKKTVEGWPPRGSKDEGQGIMFKSSDGVNWDEGYANKEFVFEFLDGRREVWRTKANVKASQLCEFTPEGAPKVGFTYRLALYMPDFPQYPATLYIVSKTATQGVMELLGKINSRRIGGTPWWAQTYVMRTQRRTRSGASNISWFVPAFDAAPNLTDRALIEELRQRSEAIYKANVVSYDEEERLQGKEDKGRRDTYEGRNRNPASPH